MSQPSLVTVAQGASDNGERWKIQVGEVDNGLFPTLLIVELPDGRQLAGGGAEPLSDQTISVSTGLNHVGPYTVVGWVKPSVDQVRLRFADKPDMSLTPVGDPTQYGVKFFAALLPRDTRLSEIAALDADQKVRHALTGVFATEEDLNRTQTHRNQRPDWTLAFGWHSAADDE